jgi:hypothetical protein
MTKFRVVLLSVLLIASFRPAYTALADTGPKPTMDFSFQQELSGDRVTIVSGTLYECDQPDCSDAAPLQQLGPQRFTCDASTCSALAYGFSDYHKLEIQFSDGKSRQSNIFKTAGFDSQYTVTIRADDLLVESQFNLLPSNPVSSSGFPRSILILLLCACLLVAGIIVAGAVAFFVLRRRKS